MPTPQVAGLFASIILHDDGFAGRRTIGCGIPKFGSGIFCWIPNSNYHAPPGGTFSQFTIGSRQICAIRSSDGGVNCTGPNINGESSPPTGAFSHITAGSSSRSSSPTCGVRDDGTGTLTCWGQGFRGSATPPAGLTVPPTTFGESNDGFLKLDSPGPFDRGDYFFYGGGASQTIARNRIEITNNQVRSLVDAGAVDYILSASIGGSGSQADEVTLHANFYTESTGASTDFCWEGPPGCTPLNSSAATAPVTPADRANQTALLPRSVSGALLSGTRFIEIVVTMDRIDGTRNDGYIDNVSMVLFASSKASFSDQGVADTQTAIVDWDVFDVIQPPIALEAGGVTQNAGFGTVDGVHAYGDQGTYTVNLTVTDNDTGSSTDPFTVTVNNVAPVVTGVPASFVNMQPTTSLVATFTDAGFLDTHDATIDWGDGPPITFALNSGQAFKDGPNPGQVFGTHEYNLSGTLPDTFNIAVKVVDDEGSFHEILSEVTVFGLEIENVSGGPDQMTVEGTSIGLSGSHGNVINPVNIFDVPGSIDFFPSWDFGDGSTADGLSVSHTYVDDGDYTVRFIVEARERFTDTLIAQGEDVVIVEVDNADPVLMVTGGGPSPNEGSTVFVGAGISDAGSADTHSAVITWGDGQSDILNRVTGFVSGSHTYADNNNYGAEICVTDDDGGSKCIFPSSTRVLNVLPSAIGITASPSATPAEGTEITLSATFTDPGFDSGQAGTQENFTATVEWDPGVLEPASGVSVIEMPGGPGVPTIVTVEVSHAYIVEGAHTAEVCVADDDDPFPNPPICQTLEIKVQNVAPIVTASGHTIDENSLATITGTITDPGVNDTFDLSITWGDGASEIFLSLSGPQFFSKTHRYRDDNGSGSSGHDYPVFVFATDDGQATGFASATVTVNNVPPAVTLSGSTIDENGTATLDGTIIDPGTQDTFNVILDWGDTTSETFSLPAAATSFSKTHQYLDDNPTATFSDAYTVTATVIDDDTGSGTGTTLVNVNNVEPMVDADTFLIVAIQTQVATSTGVFSDVGSQDTHTGTVDFGEGAGPQPLTLNSGDTYDLSHVYPDVGLFTVNVEICDDDSECGVSTQQFSVLPVDPIVTVNGPNPVNEGDSPTYTATVENARTIITLSVEWDCDGDGLFDDGTGDTNECTFSDGDDVITVSAEATNSVGGVGSGSLDVTIANVAPVVTLTGPASADEGETKSYSFTTSDPGDDDFPLASLIQSCGANGTLSAAAFNTVSGAGSFDCTYPDGPASSTVSVELDDSDGADSNVDSIVVSIANVAPVVTLSGSSSANEGETKSYGFTTVDPGDDTFSVVSQSCGANGSVSNPAFNSVTGAGGFDCTYPDGPANLTVSVEVEDDDGAGSLFFDDFSVPDIGCGFPGGIPCTSGNYTFSGITGGASGSFDISGGTLNPFTFSTCCNTKSVVLDDGVNFLNVGEQFSVVTPGGQSIFILATNTNTPGGGAPEVRIRRTPGVDPRLTTEITGAPSVTLRPDPSTGDLTLIIRRETAADFRIFYDAGDGPVEIGNGFTSPDLAGEPTLFVGVQVFAFPVEETFKFDDLSISASIPVKVNNVAPVVTLSGPASANEGETKSYDFTTSDPGDDDFPLASLIQSCGANGTLSAAAFNTVSGTGSFDCTYPDGPASSTVSVELDDSDGADSNVDSIVVSIANVAPVVTLSGSSSANEGETKSYDFTTSDPGDDDFPLASLIQSCGANGNLSAAAFNTVSGAGSFDCTYPDGPASSTVSVELDDSDGADSNVDSIVVSIANVAPVVTLTGPASADEGDTKSYSFTTSDPGDDDFPLASLIQSCGANGTPSAAAFNTVGGTGSFDCTYPDGPASSTVNVELDDSDGADSNVDSIVVSIANVAPVVTLTGPASADEGDTKSYSFTTSDPGDDDFPLGSLIQSCGANGTLSAAAFNTVSGAGSFDCTYPDGPASSTVSVELDDSDGADSNVDSIVVSIANVAPVVTLSGSSSANEGETKSYDFTTSDPGDDDFPLASLIQSCGANGTLSAAVFNTGSGTGSFDCTYPDGPASSTVSVELDDSDGADSNIDSIVVSVANVAPVVTISGDPNVNEGSLYTLNLASSDPGVDTISGWSINWGDGQEEAISGNPSGVTHTYADGLSSPTITATATDEDGSFSANPLPITVNNVEPTVDAGPDHEILAGQFIDKNATFSDPGFDNPALATLERFTSTIDWGDGSLPEEVDDDDLDETPGSEGIPTTGTVTGSHRYLLPGAYTVTVTVCDDDGGCGSDTQVVTVRAIVLVIDEDSIDNGAAAIEELAFVQGLGGGNSAVLVNDGLANPGVRAPLPIPGGVVTPLNPSASATGTIIGNGAPGGTVAPLLTGQVGDEGWFALQIIPATWAAAGPTTNGLRNYILAGPGLGTGPNPEVFLDKIPDVRPIRSAELSVLEGLTACAVVYDGDVSINFDPDQGNLQGANLGLIAFNVLDVGAPPATDSILSDVTIQVLPTADVCDGLLTLPPFGVSMPGPLYVVDGYDEKEAKTLGELGKTYLVQTTGDDWWDTLSGFSTSYQFSNPSIPAGASITSVKIYVEHWEESDFSGTVQWQVGAGWPGSPTVWSTVDSTLRIGELSEAEDVWVVTGEVNTPTRVRDMELLIQNNSTNGKLTKADYVHVEVEWFLAFVP